MHVRHAYPLALALSLAGCSLLSNPDSVELRGMPDAGESDIPTTDATVGDDLSADAAPDMTTDAATTPDVGACPSADLMGDPENCGACGQRCVGDCTAGICDAYLVADGQDFPRGLDVDSNRVYWANEDPGAVWSAPRMGGAPTLLADGTKTELQMNPRKLHLTGTDVIVIVENSGSLGHGRPLFRIPKSGGGATGFGLAADGSADFVISGSTIYYAFPRLNTIHRTALGSNDSTELALGGVPEAVSVAVAEGKVYYVGPVGMGALDPQTEMVDKLFPDEIPSAWQIRYDGTLLYIAAGATIFSLDPATRELITLQTALFEARSLTIAGDRVFFINGAGQEVGSVFSMNKVDGSDLIEHVSGVAFGREIAADADQVYWTAYSYDATVRPDVGTGLIARKPVSF